MQLKMLSSSISDGNMDIFDVKKYFEDATAAVRSNFSEVILVFSGDSRTEKEGGPPKKQAKMISRF